MQQNTKAPAKTETEAGNGGHPVKSKAEAEGSSRVVGLDYESLRREKRLAMNRETAKERRVRKKQRMELLENRVGDLTEQNRVIQESNNVLRARVSQLEAQLNMANSTIENISRSPAVDHRPSSLRLEPTSGPGSFGQDWRTLLLSGPYGGVTSAPLNGDMQRLVQASSSAETANIGNPAFLAPNANTGGSSGLSQAWNPSSLTRLEPSLASRLLGPSQYASFQQQDTAAKIRSIQMLQAQIDARAKELLSETSSLKGSDGLPDKVGNSK